MYLIVFSFCVWCFVDLVFWYLRLCACVCGAFVFECLVFWCFGGFDCFGCFGALVFFCLMWLLTSVV